MTDKSKSKLMFEVATNGENFRLHEEIGACKKAGCVEATHERAQAIEKRMPEGGRQLTAKELKVHGGTAGEVFHG